MDILQKTIYGYHRPTDSQDSFTSLSSLPMLGSYRHSAASSTPVSPCLDCVVNCDDTSCSLPGLSLLPSSSSHSLLVSIPCSGVSCTDTNTHTTPTPCDKQLTWNGPYTYMSLANFEKPSLQTQVMWHCVQRWSDVCSLVVDGYSLPLTLPTTPQTASSLPNVPEAESNQGEMDVTDVNADHDQFTMDTEPSGGFGRATLSLWRWRYVTGFQSLGLISMLSDPALWTSPSHSPGSMSSQFTHTPLQIPQHPLSLPALWMMLHSALAA